MLRPERFTLRLLTLHHDEDRTTLEKQAMRVVIQVLSTEVPDVQIQLVDALVWERSVAIAIPLPKANAVGRILLRMKRQCFERPHQLGLSHASVAEHNHFAFGQRLGPLRVVGLVPRSHLVDYVLLGQATVGRVQITKAAAMQFQMLDRM